MTKQEARYFLQGLLAAKAASETWQVSRLYQLVISKFQITKSEMAELDQDIGPYLDVAEDLYFVDDDEELGN